MSSAEATKVVGAGAPALQGEAEGPVLIQPGEDLTLGGPDSSQPRELVQFLSVTAVFSDPTGLKP